MCDDVTCFLRLGGARIEEPCRSQWEPESRSQAEPGERSHERGARRRAWSIQERGARRRSQERGARGRAWSILDPGDKRSLDEILSLFFYIAIPLVFPLGWMDCQGPERASISQERGAWSTQHCRRLMCAPTFYIEVLGLQNSYIYIHNHTYIYIYMHPYHAWGRSADIPGPELDP